jgi:hypothetical protein
MRCSESYTRFGISRSLTDVHALVSANEALERLAAQRAGQAGPIAEPETRVYRHV